MYQRGLMKIRAWRIGRVGGAAAALPIYCTGCLVRTRLSTIADAVLAAVAPAAVGSCKEVGLRRSTA
jgi:hypothetical protein